MFEGKTFLPLQGMPIAYRARSSTRLADWLPEPLTVPTRMARSFTEAGDDGAPSLTGDGSATDKVDDMVNLKDGRAPRPRFRTPSAEYRRSATALAETDRVGLEAVLALTEPQFYPTRGRLQASRPGEGEIDGARDPAA